VFISAVIELLVVVALCTPWYRTEFNVESPRLGDEVFTMYKHPFAVYTTCSGDYCDIPGADPGLHSWSEVCDNGCSNQLTLYVILWLVTLATAILILGAGVKLLWASIAVNRDKRQCALFLFKWTPLYALVLVALLLVVVVVFPVAVPSAMGNDGECNDMGDAYNTPCRHVNGEYYYSASKGKSFQVHVKWGPAEAWYLLLCALVVSIVIVPLGCIIGIFASKAATNDDINVFVPPTGGFDYYPVDTSGNQAVVAPVQSFDQYVPGYNPGSFTLN